MMPDGIRHPVIVNLSAPTDTQAAHFYTIDRNGNWLLPIHAPKTYNNGR